MNRREFAAAAAATVSAVGPAASPDSPPQAVESADLTLTPVASDRWELKFKWDRAIRILHVTDTHFSSTGDQDRLTALTLDALIRRTDPDLIVHTGDFVNNDSDDPVGWDGVDYFARRKRPWALCFGNHDYPSGAKGSRSLEEFRRSLRHCAMGYADAATGRHYCYRHDVVGPAGAPGVSLFYFQVGYARGDRKISDPQMMWFYRQLKADKERGWGGPILVFVHIPLRQYDALAAGGKAAGGVKNEDVNFDSDTGDVFQAFVASKRVTAVFCGHDHLNTYYGPWEGIGLYYGRVSGWGGYGRQWPRGGRLISLNRVTGRFSHLEMTA